MAGSRLPLILACSLAASVGQPSAHVSQVTDAVALVLRIPLERTLSAGELHTYVIPMRGGQFAHVLVAQRGIDVELTLVDPNGQESSPVNNQAATQGTEWLSTIAERPGDYRVHVRPAAREPVPGRYEVTLVEFRDAVPRDQARLDAETTHRGAEALYKRGTAETDTSAIAAFQKVVGMWRALDAPREEAQALYRLGQVHTRSSNYREAIKYFQDTIPLRRVIGDRFGEAGALQILGETYYYLGEYTNALETYDEALRARRDVADRGGEAYVLQDIGLVYGTMSDNPRALEFYERAFPLWRAVNDRRGEGLGYHNAASAWRDLGEFQKALDAFDRALELRSGAGDRQGEAQTLSQIGTTHVILGQFQSAQGYFERALPIRRLVGDRRGEGYTLLYLGQTYAALKKELEALDYLTQARSILQTIGERDGESFALLYAGRIYTSLGELPRARDFIDQALTAFRATGNRHMEADSLTNLAEVARRSKDYHTASELLASALSIYDQTRSPNGEALARFIQARVERDQGRLPEARRFVEAALDLIESERANVAGADTRASFLASKQSAFEFYIDLLMQQHRREPQAGHAAAALIAAERARSRSLLDTLTEARVDLTQDIDQGLIEREQRLHTQINARANELTRLLGDKGAAVKADDTKRDIDKLLDELNQIAARIRTSSPAYAALTAPAPLSVTDVQRRILDADSVLLEYSLGEERSFVWAVTRTSLTSHELPPRAQIESAAREVRDLLAASNLRQTGNQARLAAARLAAMVLDPVSASLGEKRLVVVADGILQYIPFAVLPVRNEPLIARHEIVYPPSTMSLTAIRERVAGRSRPLGVLAVLADPVLDDHDPRVKQVHSAADDSASIESRNRVPSGIRSTLAGLERLPFTRLEADRIVAFARGSRTLEALDFDASRQTATRPELGEYRIVHFATHAFLNDEHPELSGIVLSLVGSQGEPVDGFLRLHDIYNLKLTADLVVLSACRTALGKDIRGEGLVGLTRGFMHAGAPRVVASLWDVKDDATAELMRRFYRNMLYGGLSPAAALRAAQVSMWKEPRWQAPYYWAGFVLQGDWN